MKNKILFSISKIQRSFQHSTIVCCLLLFVCAFGAESSALAQNRRGAFVSQAAKQTQPQKIKAEKTKAAGKNEIGADAPISKSEKEIIAPSAVSIVNQPAADYLSGEANVSVNPKQPTIVRLGLARNAVSVIEFPAIDSVYYLHEGNPTLVSVFQSPTRETDRSITLYPGDAFFAAHGGKSPSVTVTLQMKSGLVIVLEIIPAPDIAANAHRCVLNYNLAEVVAARRAAGLRVNLGVDDAGSAVAPEEKSVRANSRLVADSANGEEKSKSEAEAIAVSTVFVEIETARTGRGKNDERKTKSGSAVTRLVNKKLAEAVKTPARLFANWSRPENGVRVSAAKIVEIDDFQRILLVAVKNETTETLHLLSAQPEMQIQTVDEVGKALQIERLESKYVESTVINGAISGGATAVYAIVFDAPVLGANQRLRVLAAHRSAADAPAIAEIGKNGRETSQK
jgi:hypothetical protein